MLNTIKIIFLIKTIFPLKALQTFRNKFKIVLVNVNSNYNWIAAINVGSVYLRLEAV